MIINIPKVKKERCVGVYPRNRDGKIVGYYVRGRNNGKEIYLGYSVDYKKAVDIRVAWEEKRDIEKARTDAENLDKINNPFKNELSELINEFTQLNIKSTPIVEWSNLHFLKYFNKLQDDQLNPRRLKNEKQIKIALTLLVTFRKEYPIFTTNKLFKDYIDWMFNYIKNPSNPFKFLTVGFMTTDIAYNNFKAARPNLLKLYKREAAYERHRKQFKEQEEREKQCEI